MVNGPTPTFTEILDWVEGRLTGDREEVVRRAIASDDRSAEAAAWVAEFIDAAQRMPLEKPPAELSERLRSLFVGHRESAPEQWSQARLLHDTRGAAMTGTRTAGVAEGTHLAFESDAGRFVVEVRPQPDGLVDLVGLLLLDPGAGRPVDLTVLEAGVVRRMSRVEPDGRFSLAGVPNVVDEVRFDAPGLQVRATIDLAGR